MKKRNILLSTAAALTMAAMMTVGVSAKGWQKNNTGWWYGTNDANTTWHANGWQWIDGNGDGTAECYYFDQNGYMLSATTTPDGYTVNSDGAWTYDGIVQRKNVQTTTANTTNDTTTSSHTYGEYEYDNNGISLAALDMLGRTRAENAKYGEVQELPGGTETTVRYKNGFGISYGLDGTYNGVPTKEVYISLDDPTKLFRYADESKDDEELVKILKRKTFDTGNKNLICGTDGGIVTILNLKSSYDSKYYGMYVYCNDNMDNWVVLYKQSGQE